MAQTIDQMIDTSLMYMYGMNTHQDQETHVTAAYSTTDLTISVDNASILSRGMLEVADELMQATSVDVNAGTVTIAPYGRGYRGSTAKTGAIGDRLVANPLIPRSMMASALGEAVLGVFPDLRAEGTTTFTTSGSINTYALPAGTINVLEVNYKTRGPSKEWVPARRYQVNAATNATAFPTGASISLYDQVATGTQVHIVYTAEPTELGTDHTLGFAAVTGLPESSLDVIRYGAAWRLGGMFDTPHLAGKSAEADFASNVRPIGAGQAFGKYMFQLYATRLAAESRKQKESHPVRQHYTR